MDDRRIHRSRTSSTHPQPSLLSLLLLVAAAVVCCTGQSNPVAPAGCSAAAGTCVRIGYFACRNPSTCTDVVAYNEMLAWYRARKTQLLGVPTYWVEAQQTGFFVSTTSEINATIARVFIGKNSSAPLVDFVLLPFGSVWETGMYLLEKLKIPSVSGLSPSATLYQCGPTDAAIQKQLGCKEKNSRRYFYAHCPSNPGEQYLQPWIGQLKLKKAQTVAVVRTTTPFYTAIRNGIMLTASDNHISIVYDHQVPDNLPATIDQVIANLTALPDDQQPDGLAIITQDCTPWIQAMKAADYAPKSVASILCSDGVNPIANLGADLNYIVGSSQWAPGLSGNDYTENGDLQAWALFPHVLNGTLNGETSPLQFQAFFQKLIGKPDAVPGYTEAGALVAPTMLEAAMTLANSVDPEKVNAELDVFYQTSYFGLLTANRFGQNNQKQLVVNQRDLQGVLQIISPTSSATADLIYPMPRWSERIYSQQMYATSIERAVIALLIVCCVLTIGLMVYIWHHRALQIFQAAGVWLYMTMGCGCLVAFLSVLTWPVENNSATCGARIWLWTSSFFLVVNPILASSYRIACIFSNKLHAVKITNRMVGGMCVGLAVPQVILNCLWSGLAPLEPQVITADLYRPAVTSFTTCTLGDHGIAFVGITLAYCCLLLLSAVVLAYRIRNAYAMFNDAQPIAASTFLFALVAAVVLVVQIALNNSTVSAQKVLFGLRSVGLLLAFQSSIGMLFLRRILDSQHQTSTKRPTAAMKPLVPPQPKEGDAEPQASTGGPSSKRPGATPKRKDTVTPGAILGDLGGLGGGSGEEGERGDIVMYETAFQKLHQTKRSRAAAVPVSQSYDTYVLSLMPQGAPMTQQTHTELPQYESHQVHISMTDHGESTTRHRSTVQRVSNLVDPLPPDDDLQTWDTSELLHLVRSFYTLVQDQQRMLSSFVAQAPLTSAATTATTSPASGLAGSPSSAATDDCSLATSSTAASLMRTNSNVKEQ
jgi:hypothetical protein